MYRCPRCHATRLVRTSNAKGSFFECPKCRGRAIALAVVRRVVDQNSIKHLWGTAARDKASLGVACPVCTRKMAEVGIPHDEPVLHIDVCRTCQFLWFDPHELEKLPAKPAVAEAKPLRPEVRELMAASELRVAEVRRKADMFGDESPDEAWKWIPAALGMPVEHEVDALSSRPWATWIVSGTLVLVALATFGNLHEYVAKYGFIPAEALRLAGLTLFTSFFLHAGWWHLIGNTYFLLIFGDNVEDHLGSRRFLILLAVATVAGHMLHGLCDPRTQTPCIGASGGISGVIVFYALQFPHARLGILWRYLFFIRWARFPAWVALVVWLLLQSLAGYMQLAGLSNVSAMAHFGGAAAGFAAWVLWRGGRFGLAPTASGSAFKDITDTFARLLRSE